jgi:hypothetical protein
MVFEDILENKPSHVSKILRALRELIQSLDNSLQEEILGGKVVRMASYFISNRNHVVGVIGSGKDHAQLFLHHYDHIDTMGLKLEGKGKHAKHVKIYSLDELSNSSLKDVLKQLIEIAKVKATQS